MEIIKGEEKGKRRVALVIQYEGTKYFGWQKQKEGKTIQGELEDVIESLDPIIAPKAVAAGRTDSGVHASGQVVHFDFMGHIPPKKWASALNGRLPKTIRVLESVEQDLEWHACYDAVYRRYRYTINNSRRSNLFLNPWSWHRYKFRLDENLMRSAMETLKGFHDFSTFQKVGSNRAHAWTTIQEIEIERNGDLIFFEIQASGFLYGMVRLLIGQLVAIGEHRMTLKEFEKNWKDRDRTTIREAAPPQGLCLIRVGYKSNIFSKAASFDTFPKSFINVLDPPINPCL